MKDIRDVMIETFYPSSNLRESIEKYKNTFCTQVVDIAYRFKIIEQELFRDEIKPHVFIQLLIGFLTIIKAEDPTPFLIFCW